MINCSECRKFISDDWSNLSELCSDCKKNLTEEARPNGFDEKGNLIHYCYD